MSEDALYKPSPWGQEYHALQHEEALGAGAAGPGKTLVLLMDPFQQIMVENERCSDPKHPYHFEKGMSVGWALHLRRTMPMLEQTINRSRRIFQSVDPGATFNEQTHTWKFTSGYRYQFGHCKDSNSWEQYFSNEYTHIGFDELVQFEEEQYDQISGRVRTVDPVLRTMTRVRAMSNPTVTRAQMENVSLRDPLWVRRKFVDEAPQGRVTLYKTVTLGSGEKVKRRRIYVPATLYDNPNPQFVRDYEATLRDKKPHIQQALLFGNWYVTVGSFYGDEWNPKLHVCPAFRIPNDWLRFRTMDWGFKSPGCIHWWAMDFDGNLYCEKEMTFKGLTGTEVAKRVRDHEQQMKLWKNGSLITGPADTQLWEERGATARSIAQEFADIGVGWMRADKRSRTRNALLLLSRLKDHGNGMTQPGVVFFENCVKAIQTLPAILTADNDSESPQDGGEDHWHDSALYACAFASHGRSGIPGRKSEKEKDYEPEESGRGRYGYGSEAC